MKPPLFDYQAPSTLEEAIALLAADDDAMVLAGGQSQVPAMNMRLAAPSRLVDIQHVPGLSGVSVSNGMVTIGAMVRHRDVELDDSVFKTNPLLREALGHVAHVPIRNRGTTVGSICHADAAAEMPMILLLTGGSVVAKGPGGTRTIPADQFFKFHLTTARRPDEIVVEVRFPALPEGAGHAFVEFTRRHGDYAIVALGAILKKDRNGTVSDISLAACGISTRPIRLTRAEAALKGTKLTKADIEAAVEAAAEAVDSEDDIIATAAYRKHLAGVLLRRSVVIAASRAA